uniref:F-box domain-containing protein n=1 Tax=Dunaliella tertiolecta TaxID=3047 RepID=A0A7S3R7F7_DUNTE|mmetsp:Transcript_322/g.764  ORF Transcript_322/g.764 Transcript_322/m.764 type:complete len:303 (+) Transcript_322:206-1114(+)
MPRSLLLELPQEILLVVLSYVDDPKSLQAFLRCSHETHSLRVSTTLQALWLVRNRPLSSLLDAARKAEPHLKEGVMMKLLRLPCLPDAALTATDREKMTPLHLASMAGLTLVIEQLAGLLGPARLRVNHPSGRAGRAALHLAAEHGQEAAVRTLLSIPGIQVNATSQLGVTAMHLACKHGHANVVALLAAAGADVNRASGMTCTPLHWACRGGWVGVVDALTSAHADVNKATGMGCTPLHWGAREGQVAVVQALLRKPGMDVRRKTNDGKTPLDYARASGHEEVVDALTAVWGPDDDVCAYP